MLDDPKTHGSHQNLARQKGDAKSYLRWVNASVGATIKLITVDDESSPAKAVAAVEKLASQGVVAIDGGFVAR